jgi:signal peptidase I
MNLHELKMKPLRHTLNSTDWAELQESLADHGMLAFPIVSGSMEPLIKVGDTIIVEPSSTPLQPFDIVVFRREDKLICHYVLHLNRLPGPDGLARIITRGLNSNSEDFPVAVNEILGRVTNFKISFFMRFRQALKMMRRRR